MFEKYIEPFRRSFCWSGVLNGKKKRSRWWQPSEAFSILICCSFILIKFKCGRCCCWMRMFSSVRQNDLRLLISLKSRVESIDVNGPFECFESESDRYDLKSSLLYWSGRTAIGFIMFKFCCWDECNEFDRRRLFRQWLLSWELDLVRNGLNSI